MHKKSDDRDTGQKLERSSSSAQMTRVLVMSLLIFRGQASSMLGFRPTLVCTNQRSVSQLSTNERRVLRSRDQLCHLYRDLHGRHLHHLPLWAGLGLGLFLLLQLSVHSSLPGNVRCQVICLTLQDVKCQVMSGFLKKFSTL